MGRPILIIGLLLGLVLLPLTATAPGPAQCSIVGPGTCEFECTALKTVHISIWRTAPGGTYVIAGGASCGLTGASCYTEGGWRCEGSALILTSGTGVCRDAFYLTNATCWVD